MTPMARVLANSPYLEVIIDPNMRGCMVWKEGNVTHMRVALLGPNPEATYQENIAIIEDDLSHLFHCTQSYDDYSKAVASRGLQNSLPVAIKVDWSGLPNYIGLIPDIENSRNRMTQALLDSLPALHEHLEIATHLIEHIDDEILDESMRKAARDAVFSSPELDISTIWNNLCDVAVYYTVVQGITSEKVQPLLKEMEELDIWGLASFKHPSPPTYYRDSLIALHTSAFRLGIPTHSNYRARLEWMKELVSLLHITPEGHAQPGLDTDDTSSYPQLPPPTSRGISTTTTTPGPTTNTSLTPSPTPNPTQGPSTTASQILKDIEEHEENQMTGAGSANNVPATTSMEYLPLYNQEKVSIEKAKELLKMLKSGSSHTIDIEGEVVDIEEAAIAVMLGVDLNESDIYEDTHPGNYRHRTHIYLDCSGSTSECIRDLKAAVVQLGEVLEHFKCPWSLTTYPGGKVKSADEEFGVEVKNFIAQVDSDGGTPLEEVYNQTKAQVMRGDVVIFLTDGAPDTDCMGVTRDMDGKRVSSLSIGIKILPNKPTVTRAYSINSTMEIPTLVYTFLRNVGGF